MNQPSRSSSPFQPVITGQGIADATIRGKNAAIKRYNEFVNYSNTNYNRRYKLFELAGKDDFAQEKIYQEFAHFLVNGAVKDVQKGIANNCLEEDAQGVPLELNSALQYHSGFVQSVLAKRAMWGFF